MRVKSYISIIVVTMLLTFSCSSKREHNDGFHSKETAFSSVDSIPSDTLKDVPEELPGNMSPHHEMVNKQLPPQNNYGNPHHSQDNMRGFDPASEDDMDENGMSRYMENNDDEGWD